MELLTFKIWNIHNNPLYEWWKVRKWFKRPYLKLSHIGKYEWMFGLPICMDYYNKFIDIKISNVGWKDKYDEPRFEWLPYINLLFFRKWQITWVFTYIEEPGNFIQQVLTEAVYEAMLDINYYNRTLNETVEKHCLTGTDGKTYTIAPYLTTEGCITYYNGK